MSDDLLSSAVQIVLAILASGLAVKLLTIRQDRRKIVGEATATEATAAQVLTGSALQMVEAAQRAAANAEERASSANAILEMARRDNDRLWRDLTRSRWREKQLEAVIVAAQLIVPPTGPEMFPPEDVMTRELSEHQQQPPTTATQEPLPPQVQPQPDPNPGGQESG